MNRFKSIYKLEDCGVLWWCFVAVQRTLHRLVAIFVDPNNFTSIWTTLNRFASLSLLQACGVLYDYFKTITNTFNCYESIQIISNFFESPNVDTKFVDFWRQKKFRLSNSLISESLIKFASMHARNPQPLI